MITMYNGVDVLSEARISFGDDSRDDLGKSSIDQFIYCYLAKSSQITQMSSFQIGSEGWFWINESP